MKHITFLEYIIKIYSKRFVYILQDMAKGGYRGTIRRMV